MDSPYKSKFMIISLVIIDIALILAFYFSQPFFTACLNGTQCPSFDTLHIWIIDILIPLNFLILVVISKKLKYSISRKNVTAIIFFLICLWSIVEVLLVFFYRKYILQITTQNKNKTTFKTSCRRRRKKYWRIKLYFLF